jgi:hypothetical protein
VANATETDLSQDKLPRPNVKEMADALFEAFLRAYRVGRESVLAEARLARVAVGKADEGDEGEDELEGLYPPVPSRAERSWIRRLSEGAAIAMTLKLVTEAIGAGQRAQDQRQPKSEIEAQVRLALSPIPMGGRLSESVVEADIAGSIVHAFTNGRVEQGLAMADQISSVFYTARMDNNTCGPCAGMDGAELGTGTWQAVLPNPDCEGGDRCRCEPVFVFRQAKQEDAA